MSIQTCLKKSHTICQHRAVAVIWQQCTDTQVALVCRPIATHDLPIGGQTTRIVAREREKKRGEEGGTAAVYRWYHLEKTLSLRSNGVF